MDLYRDYKNVQVIISHNPNDLKWHIMFFQAIHSEILSSQMISEGRSTEMVPYIPTGDV